MIRCSLSFVSLLWSLLLLGAARSFAPQPHSHSRPTIRLNFQPGDTTMLGQNATVAVAPPFGMNKGTASGRLHHQHRRRELLKRQLAAVAIEDYQAITRSQSLTATTTSTNTRRRQGMTAEDIMRKLEDYCPVARPVHEPELLNARWTFCFTGMYTFC